MLGEKNNLNFVYLRKVDALPNEELTKICQRFFNLKWLDRRYCADNADFKNLCQMFKSFLKNEIPLEDFLVEIFSAGTEDESYPTILTYVRCYEYILKEWKEPIKI